MSGITTQVNKDGTTSKWKHNGLDGGGRNSSKSIERGSASPERIEYLTKLRAMNRLSERQRYAKRMEMYGGDETLPLSNKVKTSLMVNK